MIFSALHYRFSWSIVLHPGVDQTDQSQTSTWLMHHTPASKTEQCFVLCIHLVVELCTNVGPAPCRWFLQGMSAVPGMVPMVKRQAVADNKSGIPMYQPGAGTTAYQQAALAAMSIQQPFVPVTSQYTGTYDFLHYHPVYVLCECCECMRFFPCLRLRFSPIFCATVASSHRFPAKTAKNVSEYSDTKNVVNFRHSVHLKTENWLFTLQDSLESEKTAISCCWKVLLAFVWNREWMIVLSCVVHPVCVRESLCGCVCAAQIRKLDGCSRTPIVFAAHSVKSFGTSQVSSFFFFFF